MWLNTFCTLLFFFIPLSKVRTIMARWQNLLDNDKQLDVLTARHQDKLKWAM